MTRALIIESGQEPTEERLKEVEEAKKALWNCGTMGASWR